MYKMCPSNEVKTASFGGNLSYWMYLFVQIRIIVLFCNRFVSNFSTRQSVKKVKIRRRRRTCADDGDTTREILRQIVCEEQSDECAICRKILSKATKPSAACGGYSEAEQGQRSQSASALVRAPRDADTATRGFQRGK